MRIVTMWLGHRLPLVAAGTLLAGCGGAEPGPQSAGPDVVAATHPDELVLDRGGGGPRAACGGAGPAAGRLRRRGTRPAVRRSGCRRGHLPVRVRAGPRGWGADV